MRTLSAAQWPRSLDRSTSSTVQNDAATDESSVMRTASKTLGLLVHGPDLGVLDGQDDEAPRIVAQQRLDLVLRP